MGLIELLERWDHLSALEAAARAWVDPAPSHRAWHRQAKEEISFLMPMLARALDRLIEECDVYPPDWELWVDVPQPTVRRFGPSGRGY